MSESDEVSQKTEIELTNMCLVYDENRVLVQEKTGTKYKGGLVFPGGHVEEGESLRIKCQDLMYKKYYIRMYN